MFIKHVKSGGVSFLVFYQSFEILLSKRLIVMELLIISLKNNLCHKPVTFTIYDLRHV